MQRFLQNTVRVWPGLIVFLGLSAGANAQVTLPASGTYTETFDGIGSALPTGWTVRTGATATALGSSLTYVSAPTAWTLTTGQFRNVASGDIDFAASAATQNAATDRSLAVRQVGQTSATFPDSEPGASFVLQIANTTGLQNLALNFKLQSQDASSARQTTWTVDYATGASPSAFSALTTGTTGNSATSNNTISAALGNVVNNNAGPVWIRISALTASTGSGNRPTTGIDDFVLTYTASTTPQAPVAANAIPAQTGTVGQAYSYTVPANTFTDANGDVLTLSASTLPTGLSLVGRVISGTPSTTVGSPFRVTITATDPGSLSASTAFVFTINPAPASNSPSLTASPTVLSNFTTTQGTASAPQSAFVTGANLSPSSYTASVSSGYEISLSGPPSYSSRFTFISLPNSFTSQIIIRLAATAAVGPQSGTLLLSGSNSTSAVVILNGTVSSTVAQSPFTPIGTARGQVGQTVNIQGRVTVSSQFGGRLFYIQDATGGIGVYSGASPATPIGTTANLGDLVTLTGPVAVFAGYVEINGVSAYTITPGTTANVPAPVLTTLDQLSANQGRLVTVTAATIGGPGATFTSGTNYPITVGAATGVLRINGSSELLGASKPATSDITGIAERFLSGATTAGNDNIQLQPRILTDVPSSSAVAPSDQFCGGPANTTLSLDQTFELAAFNIEFFGAPAGTIACPSGNLNYQNQGPGNELLQAQNVNKVLTAVNADVFVLEEVSDATLLQNNLPPGYALSCSNRFSFYFQDECTQTPSQGFVFGPTNLAQKVCVAYKTSTVTSVSAMALLSDYYGFPNTTPTVSAPNNWGSGRLPYLFVADATINGVTRRLNIVGLHAKSGSATADYNRRKQDVQDLYNLLTNSSTGPGSLGGQFPMANLIIAGDFNDYVTKSIATGQNSTYKPFVDDVTNFSVLTKGLETAGCNSFFGASGTSFLDHIVVSNELFNAYVPNSTRIQTSFSAISGDLTSTTSDHRPVFASFDLSKIASPVASNSAPIAAMLMPQSATVGQPFSYTVPAFSDPNGDMLTYSATGLPANGLSFNAGTRVITGTPSTTVGSPLSVTITATDPGTLSARASFTITIAPAGSVTMAAPLAVTVVSYNCTTGDIVFGRIGGDMSKTVEYSAPGVVNGVFNTTTNRRIEDGLRNESNTANRLINLRGRYVDEPASEVTFTFDFRTACGQARQGIEPASVLQLSVFGNPTSDETVTVEIRGAEGQAVQVSVLDMQGQRLDSQSVESANMVERQVVRLGKSAGVYLLTVSTDRQRKTVKVVRQ